MSKWGRVALVTLGACVLAFALLGQNALRAQQVSSLDDYRRAVAATIAFVERAHALPVTKREPLLSQARQTLTEVTAVQLPDGSSLAVDNTDLLTLLRNTSRTDEALKRLQTLQSALDEPLRSVTPAQLASLQNILNNPPFAQPQQADNALGAFLLYLIQLIEDIISNAVRGAFEIRDLFVVLGVALFLGVIIYFVRNLRRNLVPEQELEQLENAEIARTPDEALENAQRYINVGDYRSAVRQLYLATLLTLDRRGKLKYDPTLTNREYLRRAAADPRAASALRPIVDTFDRTWYGFEPISQAEFETYRKRVDEVQGL